METKSESIQYISNSIKSIKDLISNTNDHIEISKLSSKLYKLYLQSELYCKDSNIQLEIADLYVSIISELGYLDSTRKRELQDFTTRFQMI